MMNYTYWNISETPNQEKKQPTEINPEMTHTNKNFKVVMNMFKDFHENTVQCINTEISVKEYKLKYYQKEPNEP